MGFRLNAATVGRGLIKAVAGASRSLFCRMIWYALESSFSLPVG